MNNQNPTERKIILYIATSLDGFIARENGDLDWLPGASGVEEDNLDENDCGYREFFDSVDTVLMGHNTYRQILSFDCEFPYKGKTNFVFSRSPQPPDENVEFVTEDIEIFVKRLKASQGKNIWLNGGASLFASLYAKNLVDELILFVVPVTLGNGISLFPKPSEPAIPTLKLLESSSYSEGVAKGIVKLHYEVQEQ